VVGPLSPAVARLIGAVVLGVCVLLACCSGGAPAPVAGPPPAAPVQVTSTPALAAAPPVRIRIPAIGVDSALIGLGLQADGTLEVPADGSVAGWFTGAPTPGSGSWSTTGCTGAAGGGGSTSGSTWPMRK